MAVVRLVAVGALLAAAASHEAWEEADGAAATSNALIVPRLGPPAAEDARAADWRTAGEPQWTRRRVRWVRVLDGSFDEDAPRYDGVELFRSSGVAIHNASWPEGARTADDAALDAREDEEGPATVAVFSDLRLAAAAAVRADCKVALRVESEAVSPLSVSFANAQRMVEEPGTRAHFDVVLTHSAGLLSAARADGVSAVLPFPLGKCELAVCAPVAERPRESIPADAPVSIVFSRKRSLEGHQLRHTIWERFGGQPAGAAGARSAAAALRGCGSGVDGRRWSAAEREACLRESTHTVVIENSREEWWVTEKLVDAFLARAVPIYWGAPRAAQLFDPRGVHAIGGADELGALLAGPLRSAELRLADYEAKRAYIDANARAALAYAREPFARVLELLVSADGRLTAACAQRPRASLEPAARKALAAAEAAPAGTAAWAARVVQSGCLSQRLQRLVRQLWRRADRLRAAEWRTLRDARGAVPRTRAQAEALADATAASAPAPIQRVLSNDCLRGPDKRRMRWLALARALTEEGGGVGALPPPTAAERAPAQPPSAGGAASAPEPWTVFIAVITAPSNAARRERVRHAWFRPDGGAHGAAGRVLDTNGACDAEGGGGRAAWRAGCEGAHAAARFFVGEGRSGTPEPPPLAPSDDAAGDVVRLAHVADGPAAYQELWRKVLAALAWAVRACPSGWVLKADDDVFVHTPTLLRRLEEHPATHEASARAYIGSARHGAIVDRNPRSKAFVPAEVYGARAWPPFNQGIHYALSAPLARWVAAGAVAGRLRAPGGVAGEDVSMALWLQEAGVPPQSLPWFFYVHAGRYLDAEGPEVEATRGCVCDAPAGARVGGPAVIGLDSPDEEELAAELRQLREAFAAEDGACACDVLPPRWMANEGRRLYYRERDVCSARVQFEAAARACKERVSRCSAAFASSLAEALAVVQLECTATL